jgi:hypothetical protein
MDKLQLRYTPEEAEHIADVLNRAALDAESAAEVRDLVEQAARLNHLAAKARARAARAAAE